MRRVAIFGAMPWECLPFARRLRQVTRRHLDASTVWAGSAAGLEVHVVKTGVGMERAQRAAGAALQAGSFDLLVSTGCAGALTPELRPGHVIIASAVIAGDSGNRFPTDTAARQCLARIAERTRLRTWSGDLLSVAAALITPESKRAAAERTGAIAVDMEGAAIAARAAAASVPFASLRTVLDSLDADLVEAPGVIDPQSGGVKPMRLARYLATHPAAVPRLLAVRRMIASARQSLERCAAAWLQPS